MSRYDIHHLHGKEDTRMSDPMTPINVKESTKARLINLRWHGESLDETIQRMLNALEIPTPKIRKISFVNQEKRS